MQNMIADIMAKEKDFVILEFLPSRGVSPQLLYTSGPIKYAVDKNVVDKYAVDKIYEGRLRPFFAEGGLRPSIYAGLARGWKPFEIWARLRAIPVCVALAC
jgi:hypothetical protein